MNIRTEEQKKYERVWGIPDYRKISPGLLSVKDFLPHLEIGDTITDLGSGTGRAGDELAKEGFRVRLFDIAKNSKDPEVTLPFIQGCLWEDPLPKASWGYCCDVMEHIPGECVEDTLWNIHRAFTKGVYFRIYLHRDNGKFIDEPLHLTVQDNTWWLERLSKYWDNITMDTNGTVATFICRYDNDEN